MMIKIEPKRNLIHCDNDKSTAMSSTKKTVNIIGIIANVFSLNFAINSVMNALYPLCYGYSTIIL